MANKQVNPKPGWWAVQHNVGHDRRLSLLPEEHVLSALGLLVATNGWAIAFETPFVTEADLSRHNVVGAASSESVMEAARQLIAAGIWTEVPGVGIDCGAGDDIKAKTKRIETARRGGVANQSKLRGGDLPEPPEESDEPEYEAFA